MEPSRNIEIKARLPNPEGFLDKINILFKNKDLCLESSPIQQKDYFFKTHEKGVRLKLRVINDLNTKNENGPLKTELISYKREDTDSPKLSTFYRTTVEHEKMYNILSMSHGPPTDTVEKVRILFIYEQTRIHYDNVKGLGHFMELEVVLNKNQSEIGGQRTANNLMKLLDIKEEDLIKCAYVDLLKQQQQQQVLGSSLQNKYVYEDYEDTMTRVIPLESKQKNTIIEGTGEIPPRIIIEECCQNNGC